MSEIGQPPSAWNNLDLGDGKKRAPLLSDEALGDIAFDMTSQAPTTRIRDFYEDLITRGVLMVVKTAELYHPSVPEDVWREWLTGSSASFGMLVTKCCHKNPWSPPWGLGKGEWDDKERCVVYPNKRWVCPGCGATIVKP